MVVILLAVCVQAMRKYMKIDAVGYDSVQVSIALGIWKYLLFYFGLSYFRECLGSPYYVTSINVFCPISLPFFVIVCVEHLIT